MIGVSREVLTHHSNQHECSTPARPTPDLLCPCGTTVAIVCRDCGSPVFAAVRPDAGPCWHTVELMSGAIPSGIWTATSPEAVAGWSE